MKWSLAVLISHSDNVSKKLNVDLYDKDYKLTFWDFSRLRSKKRETPKYLSYKAHSFELQVVINFLQRHNFYLHDVFQRIGHFLNLTLSESATPGSIDRIHM